MFLRYFVDFFFTKQNKESIKQRNQALFLFLERRCEMKNEEVKQVAKAIIDYCRNTSRDIREVMEDVSSGVLVPVYWNEKEIIFVFSSLNGL